MTNQAIETSKNERFLSLGLTWLRMRLEVLIAALPEAENLEQPGKSGRLWKRKKDKSKRAQGPSAAAVAAAYTEMEASAAAGEAPPNDQLPLLLLQVRFGLSDFERHVLLLCAAMELDTRIPELCARAQDNAGRPFPTFALALVLFENPVWDVVSPERPLRYCRLIDVLGSPAMPLTARPLHADERLVSYIKGLNYLDPRLAPLLTPFEAGEGELAPAPSQQRAVESVTQLMGAADRGFPTVIQLIGPDPASRQLVARHAARALGLTPLRLPTSLLPADPEELEALLRLWQKEQMLLPLVLYLDHEDGGDLVAGPLARFLSRGRGGFMLGAAETRRDLGSRSPIVKVDKPTTEEQETAWRDVLAARSPQSPALLAAQFSLNLAVIRQIANMLTATPACENDHTRLWDACLEHTRPRIEQLAARLEPKATWNDIVLPEREIELLNKVTHQVEARALVYNEWGYAEKMNRGLGISVLFAGESGTGKTMAAEVMANALRLNLYRIDLSAVISKYIGETEKNLRRLFDAAENGGAVLFFDEADALFGKRSEVKDSHDRYANIEINYLLQRMESYRGLAILATNMKKHLDQAFTRRLRFVVDFPFPGRGQREQIWRKSFAAGVPLEALDYGQLAGFKLTGGNIHNIALNASFLAARAGSPVTMPVVLEATRDEYRKMEKPIREREFALKQPSQEHARPAEVLS